MIENKNLYIIYEDSCSNHICKMNFEFDRQNKIVSINKFVLENGEFITNTIGYNNEIAKDIGISLPQIKRDIIDYIVINCKIIFIKGDNRSLVLKSDELKNKEFRKIGSTLHQLRLPIHKLCVEFAHEWKFGHNAPISVFCPALEELIINAVDLGNWAKVEMYDPLDFYE